MGPLLGQLWADVGGPRFAHRQILAQKHWHPSLNKVYLPLQNLGSITIFLLHFFPPEVKVTVRRLSKDTEDTSYLQN